MLLVPSELTTVKYRHRRAAPVMHWRLELCQSNKQFLWKLKLFNNLIELENGQMDCGWAKRVLIEQQLSPIIIFMQMVAESSIFPCDSHYLISCIWLLVSFSNE